MNQFSNLYLDRKRGFLPHLALPQTSNWPPSTPKNDDVVTLSLGRPGDISCLAYKIKVTLFTAVLN